MSITYVGGTGLMDRLGQIFGAIRDANLYLGSGTANYSDSTNTLHTVHDRVTDLFAKYPAAMQYVPAGSTVGGASSVFAGRDSARSALDGWKQYLAGLALATLTEEVYVNADVKPKTKALADVMASLIDDMVGSGTIYAADDEVDTQTFTCTAGVNSTPSNTGDGRLACATNAAQDFSSLRMYRPDGRDNEYLFAETIDFICTDDKGTGGTEGSETFSFTGEPAASSSLAWDYPLGSGCTGTTTAVNASLDEQDDGNLLVNSDFQDFTANVPDTWTVLSGTPGTDIVKETSSLYTGDIVSTATLKFPEDGTPSLCQVFGTDTDTELEPSTIYVGGFWVKKSAALSAGVLEVGVINSANALITNDAAHDLKFQLAHGTMTTSFAFYSWMWVTPKQLPATLKFRIRMSTAANSAGGGESVQISRMALAKADELYQGGVFARVFSGVESFAVGDRLTCAVAKTVTGDFQDYFQRVFDMRALGMQLPTDSAAGESIADTLLD